MTEGLLTDLTVFALAVLVGFEVISKVPAILHTPLMSGANAIHGIVLVGAMVITAQVSTDYGYILGGFAMLFAAMNVVGYVITDRMLHMFKRRPTPARPALCPSLFPRRGTMTRRRRRDERRYEPTTRILLSDAASIKIGTVFPRQAIT